MYMNGTLWKWTNYFSGWQERWFVLDNGILSYYKSQDDVNTGCKGSIKMSVCDIAVHATDSTRLDLIIPGEQHFYVKAATPQERQQWLVALGSAKASTGKATEDSDSGSLDLMKTKRSELRLYCDLLMQQIHSVKVTIQDREQPVEGITEKLDGASSLISPTCDMFISTLQECMDLAQSSTNMPFEGHSSPITDAALPPSPLRLPNKKGKAHRQNSSDRPANHSRSPSVSSAESPQNTTQTPRQRTASDTSLHEHVTTTDHGIQTHSHLYDSKHKHSTHSKSSGHGNSGGNHHAKSVAQNLGSVQSNGSSHSNFNSNYLSTNHNARLHNISETGSPFSVNSNVNGVNSNNNAETSQLVTVTQSSNGDHNGNQSDLNKEQDDGEVFLDPIEQRVPTFFSVMPTTLMDLKLTSDGGIPVEPFLEACKNLLPIFDKLNSTAFAPVKMDFQGNIRKIRTKYQLHPEQFTTLQSIILHEISKKQQTLPSSATIALLWLKRSLEFIAGFVHEVRQGETNLSVAATKAYTQSLKPFHGWVVRGVFAVAVKALPYRDTFMTLLNPSEGAVDPQAYSASLMLDIEAFCDSCKVVVDILNAFFMSHNLNVNEQI